MTATAPPEPPAIAPLPPDPDDLSTYLHRQLIGYLGMFLPLLVWLVAGWRRLAGPGRWTLLTSVSAYYHTGAVAVFAGILSALAVFLFTYRGYANETRRRDRIAAIVAGTAATLVAFFPTGGPGDQPTPYWWTGLMGKIHYGAAAVLFGAFIFFSLVQFPKSRFRRGDPLPTDKFRRNVIYRVCGWAMLVCVAWAGIASWRQAPIFWPEALALEFFGISWLAKGRAGHTFGAIRTRTMFYGRHPGRLTRDAWRALSGRRASIPVPRRATIDAGAALARLREGNQRFVANRTQGSAPADPARRAALVAGQEPFAIILGCSDSRVPAELVFDQGFGDLFVIRVAGNVVAPSQIGSVEFAAARFGTRLVLVMGHSQCGAVTAALEELLGRATTESRNLRSIVYRVRPAIEPLLGGRHAADPDALLREAVRANVRAAVHQLRHGSDLLERLIREDGLLVAGAEYSLETGVVEFFDDREEG